MKAALGHDGPPTQFWQQNVVTGEPLTRCPRRVELDAVGTAAAAEVDEVRRMVWPHYKRGFLPVAGGVSDQPALVMELLALLEATDALTKARHRAVAGESERTDDITD